MHAFRAAVEAGDIDAAIALLHEDVVFRSPVVFKPYEGREVVGVILRAVAETFEDFRYVREIGAAGEGDVALLFQARVGDRELDGADFLVTDADGLITELMVMVRPMSGMHALAEAMGRRLAGAG
jgi:ketosteroid isomerase-like protein